MFIRLHIKRQVERGVRLLANDIQRKRFGEFDGKIGQSQPLGGISRGDGDGRGSGIQVRDGKWRISFAEVSWCDGCSILCGQRVGLSLINARLYIVACNDITLGSRQRQRRVCIGCSRMVCQIVSGVIIRESIIRTITQSHLQPSNSAGSIGCPSKAVP